MRHRPHPRLAAARLRAGRSDPHPADSGYSPPHSRAADCATSGSVVAAARASAASSMWKRMKRSICAFGTLPRPRSPSALCAEELRSFAAQRQQVLGGLADVVLRVRIGRAVGDAFLVGRGDVRDAEGGALDGDVARAGGWRAGAGAEQRGQCEGDGAGRATRTSHGCHVRGFGVETSRRLHGAGHRAAMRANALSPRRQRNAGSGAARARRGVVRFGDVREAAEQSGGSRAWLATRSRSATGSVPSARSGRPPDGRHSRA